MDYTEKAAAKVGTFLVSGEYQRAVALETAIMSCLNSQFRTVHCVNYNVGVLLDTGAQRSLVSKECVKRLGLPTVATEKACLQGVGQVRASIKNNDVVRLALGPPH